jgi:hypothetical protein
MFPANYFWSIVFIIVVNHSGCGSPSNEQASGLVSTKSKNDKRSARYGKLEKSLEDYFVAYGIPGGSEGWKDRFKLFTNHIDSLTDPEVKVSYENLLGRVLQDLTIRDTRRKVGSSSSWTFSPHVHLFMSICRALSYVEHIRSTDSFPHKDEFIREYYILAKTLTNTLTSEIGGLHPGQRFTGFFDSVGLMQKLVLDASPKSPPGSPDAQKLVEEALRFATDIYELDGLKVVPNTVINGDFDQQLFKSLSKLKANCSHNDHVLPGLTEQIVDKCYAGLQAYKKGLEKVLITGDASFGSEGRQEFDNLLKINKEILGLAEKVAIAELGKD